MHDAALARFLELTTKCEGRVGDHLPDGRGSPMYLDVRSLVTTDIGILIDPVETAIGLPWRLPSGQLATPAEVTEEWWRLKRDPHAAKQGWRRAASVTRLRLLRADVDKLFSRKVESNEAILRRLYPDFDSWPDGAQIATHSMAWALGPYFRGKFPRLDRALLRGDFREAAKQCEISSAGNPGVIPRNEAARALYESAVLGQVTGEDEDTVPDFRPAQPLKSAGTPICRKCNFFSCMGDCTVSHTVTQLPRATVCPKCQLMSCDGDCG